MPAEAGAKSIPASARQGERSYQQRDKRHHVVRQLNIRPEAKLGTRAAGHQSIAEDQGQQRGAEQTDALAATNDSLRRSSGEGSR